MRPSFPDLVNVMFSSMGKPGRFRSNMSVSSNTFSVLNIGWVIGKWKWTCVPRLMKIVALVSSSAISKFGFVITWSMSKVLRVSSTSLLCGAPKSW